MLDFKSTHWLELDKIRMTTIPKIEKILDIKLEKKQFGKLYDPNQKNTYSGTQEYVESLRLDDVVIDDFSKLFPYLNSLRVLKINNSTIPNFSELLDLNCDDLYLDNVIFKNNDCKVKGKLPWHLKFLNMKFDATALRCFKKTNAKGFRQVEFSKCHIDNIQYINEVKPISFLIFNNITFTHKRNKKASKSSTKRLTIYNSKFKDVSFLPFKSSLEDIQFVDCKIGSIAGLTKFPNLRKLSMNTDTTVKEQSVQKNNSNKKILCVLNQGEKSLDLRMIRSIRKLVHELLFFNYKGKKIKFIQEFKEVKHLSFEESKVYIDAFLPIAKQIESIAFTKSIIKNQDRLEQFKNLIKFKIKYYGKGNKGLGSFEKILPLKKQLKILDIDNFAKIKATHLIEEFTALESLKISSDISVKTAKHILTIKNLKQLHLCIAAHKKKYRLNFKKLKKLEALILENEVKFTGFRSLKKLKALKLSSDSTIDINSIPKLKNLSRLNITGDNSKIKILKQFPNLEYLSLRHCSKCKLGKLSKLKVLDLENSGIRTFSTFKELPNLEKLNLSSLYNDDINLKGLYKFPNLKSLTLLESRISDLSGLEPLKKLEYLDLYYTKVLDVRVLNTLPNLKGVNLATKSSVNLEEQLDKPEIAVYCGLPSVYLWIWEKDEFGI